jgi:DNA-binding winged helix-turn-helix (wHTH) protein
MMESRSLADLSPNPGESDGRGSDNPVETERARPLSRRPDLRLGNALVRPSLRTIEGPDGSATLEPRVMRVLLALIDAGAVLSRDELLEICWDGVIVSDDSVHRAIAELRREARAAGADFKVETIPRIGYRLDGAASEAAAPPMPIRTLSRRMAIGGGAAAVAAVGGGLWWYSRGRPDPRLADRIERGRQALRQGLPDSDAQGIDALREAVGIDPGSAEAWGMLALALRQAAENAAPDQVAGTVQECEAAGRRALAIDPREGNALTALATVRPAFGDWIGYEDRLRRVLAVAPDNVAAIDEMVVFLQSVGRGRESFALNERSLQLDPLSPIGHYRQALKHWIFGRTGLADQAADRGLQLWPRHPAVWNARLLVFAFTGRPRAARALLDDVARRPAQMTERAADIWRISLQALETRAPADVAAARTANMEASRQSPGFAVNAIMVLPALSEVDAAFAVTDGFLLRRGPLIGSLFTGAGQMPVNDQRWRRTMMLFTPACAPLRRDRRFDELCEGLGFEAYWRRRGVVPDHRAGVI